MKSPHQSAVVAVHAVAVSAAPFGALNGYMVIEPEKVHAKQSSVLFRVDAPQSVATGQPQAPAMLGVAWTDARTPVGVFGFCLGKVYIAAAFNLLDPSTRARLEEARISGKFTAVVEFNSNDSSKATANFDSALIGIPAEAFDDVLKKTEGLKSIDAQAWREVATSTMLEWVVANGIDNSVFKRLRFSAFCVVPVEADGELCAGWA